MRRLLIILTLVTITSVAFGQSSVFRSGIFLHHSTGFCIWGPNGSNTSVPTHMIAYNAQHAYTGSQSVSLAEQWWPSVSKDNEWATWDKIFMNTGTDDIRPILTANGIIVIKSCFPSSTMTGVGSASDTVAGTAKTIYNYKWHWRRIVNVMKAHPSNFFVIWTNAPEVSNTLQAAGLSEKFCRWAKDTLAVGRDMFGRFPTNVYVFDFFHKVAGSDGRLKPVYAMSPTDSHPDSLATELVAPQFVKEIFDAAVGYEHTLSVEPQSGEVPRRFGLYQNYPNPFNPTTSIRYEVPNKTLVTINLYDIVGRLVKVLVNEEKEAGSYLTTLDVGRLASGVYYYSMQAGSFVATRPCVLLR